MSTTNTSTLPSRFQIRKLEPDHLPWANAVICHSNAFCSPLWSIVYPADQHVHTCLAMYDAADYLVRHQIESGLSYGVFDTEYKFRRPSSASTSSGGAIYWPSPDDRDAVAAATKDTLLDGMDNPLVSIALSYDAASPLDMARLKPLLEVLPLFGTLYGALAAGDTRDPNVFPRTVTEAGQVLMRNGTSTRCDYEGMGIVRGMADWLMREVRGMGFMGVQIECGHDAVTHTWMHPPKPFAAQLVATVDAKTFEEDKDGEKVRSFAPSEQVCTKVFVTL